MILQIKNNGYHIHPVSKDNNNIILETHTVIEIRWKCIFEGHGHDNKEKKYT